MKPTKLAEYKAVASGYRCSNCQHYTVTATAHYCPSCALPMDNWEERNEPTGAHGYGSNDEFGGSDF